MFEVANFLLHWKTVDYGAQFDRLLQISAPKEKLAITDKQIQGKHKNNGHFYQYWQHTLLGASQLKGPMQSKNMICQRFFYMYIST